MGTNPIRLPPGFILEEQEEQQVSPPPGFVLEGETTAPAPETDRRPGGMRQAWDAAINPGPEAALPERVEASVLKLFKGFGDKINPFPALKEFYDSGFAFSQHPGEGLMEAQFDELKKGKRAYDEGRYSEAAGHTMAGMLPLMGPAAAHTGEKIGEGEIAEGLGETAAMLSPFALNKVRGSLGRKAPMERGPSVVGGVEGGSPWRFVEEKGSVISGRGVLPKLKGSSESFMKRGIKPGKNNTRWDADMRDSMPHMKAAETVMGRPIKNIDDALEAVKLAKERLWARYEAKLGANQHASIDGNKIADSMLRSVSKRSRTQNPGAFQRLQEKVNTYRFNPDGSPRRLTLAEAEDYLQDVNKNLEGFYAKNKVSQSTARSDTNMGPVVAEGEALRRELYGTLDELEASGAVGAKQLKREYGALSNIQKEMNGRKNVLERQNPDSLAEQISFARGGAEVAGAVLSGHPGLAFKGMREIALARYLKQRGQTNSLIEKAFKKYQKTEFVDIPTPVPFKPTGLITERAGPPQLTPIPSHGIRVSEAGRGVVRDPKTGRMKRFYQSE